MKRFKLYLYLIAAASACSLPASAGDAVAWTNGLPAFDAKLVFSYGHRAGVTSTVALLNLAGGTNRSELPGGTHEFYFVFEGHRYGKDVYTIGTTFPVGGTNEVSTVKQVKYAGKRVRFSLNKEDTVVIEPRKAAK